jgi:uncharacterized membrane-anchored protein
LNVMNINQITNPLTSVVLGVVTIGLLYLLLRRYRIAEKQYHDDFQGWI